MDDVQKMTTLGFQVANFATDSMNAATTIIFNALSLTANRSEESRILLNELQNDRELDIIYCSANDAKKIEDRLKKEGISCVTGSHNIKDSATRKIYEKNFVIFSEKDQEQVRKFINEIQVEQGYGAVSTEILLNTDDAIRCIKEIDYKDAVLFLEHCEDIGIPISLKEVEKNKYNIYYQDNDNTAMDNVKMTIALEQTGLAGEYLKKQVEYENNNFVRINEKILTTSDPFEVVDTSNHRLSIDKKGITFFYKDQQINYSRSSSTFNNDVCKIMSMLKNPVDLSWNEYNEQKYMDQKKRRDYLYKKDVTNGRPEITKEEYGIIKKMQQNQELYEKKLALENPVQQLYSYAYTNNEMRMASFEAYEEMNKEHNLQIISDIHDEEVIKVTEEKFTDFYSDYIDIDGFLARERNEKILEEIENDNRKIDLDMNGIDDREEEMELE